MEALGGTAQTIQFSELPMALKQGLVDGLENPVSVIYAFKIYETQKYLAMTGHTYNSMVHVISKKTWDKLTPEKQKIIKEESKRPVTSCVRRCARPRRTRLKNSRPWAWR
jgi:TRAP-type C4-dicarboxylate transport system substrate-binding protein